MNTQGLNRILLEYLAQTIKRVSVMSLAGQGKKVLGEVPGRPEDLEIEIDRAGEEILKHLLVKEGVDAQILSECEINNTGARKGTPELYVAIDPFDNTILFFTGFRHTWYTALTFYDKERKPLCAGIGDILNNTAWIFDGEKTCSLDLTAHTQRIVSPHTHKNIEGPVVLASYLMSSQYSVKFLHYFWNTIKRMHPKALLYPFGGSHIYGYLTDGRIDAYVMFDEPRSEIDPGFAIARAVGCEVGEVDKSGNWHDYKFIPSKHQEKIGLLIAACTRELRDELISYYKTQLKKS